MQAIIVHGATWLPHGVIDVVKRQHLPQFQRVHDGVGVVDARENVRGVDVKSQVSETALDRGGG